MHRTTALAALLLTLAACGYVPFSGGELQGTLTPHPGDWTEAASPDIIELETNPFLRAGDPAIRFPGCDSACSPRRGP